MTTSATPEFEQHLTLTALLERGWTRAAVTRFLGDADATRPNPRYRSASPVRLYALARVERVEGSDEWTDWRDRSQRRSASAREVAKQRRSETLAEAEAVEFDVEVLPLRQVTRRAVDAYNERLWATGRADAEPASVRDDRGFLNRITVNYVRHEMTSYDTDLDALYARVGRDLAYEVIRGRVLGAIAEAYPALAGECHKQAEPETEPW